MTTSDLQAACLRYRAARDAYFSASVAARCEDLRRTWISAAVEVAELSADPLPVCVSASSGSSFFPFGPPPVSSLFRRFAGDKPLPFLGDILLTAAVWGALAFVASRVLFFSGVIQ
jgi:hypothetical protein